MKMIKLSLEDYCKVMATIQCDVEWAKTMPGGIFHRCVNADFASKHLEAYAILKVAGMKYRGDLK